MSPTGIVVQSVKTMSNEPCPGCGHVHSVPFSETVRALASRILESSSAEEKHSLMLELADSYAEEVDWTDLSLPEELHSLTEEHMKLKADSYAASMRLGRFLVRLVAAFESHRKNGEPSEMRSAPFPSAVKTNVGPN